MRLRPLAALSAAAVSVLLLAGCAGAGGGDASPSPTASAAADLCSSAAPSGAISDGVKVSGDFGAEPTVDFTKPIDITDLKLERTVTTKGDGAALTAGDFVDYAATIFDGATGAVLSSQGYTPGEILPEQISADNGGQLFGCATIGSRITVAAATGNETTPSVIYVIDVLGVTPTAASGEPQTPVDGLPTVALGDGGNPTITVPAGLKIPDTTQVEVLKKGDGATVQPGDTVLVQYTGVLTDGTVFDSSWKTGVPVSFQTTQVVVGFGKALEGQTVGSQVLAVIPASEGYGAEEKGSIPANSPLIFVVDILATSVTSNSGQ